MIDYRLWNELERVRLRSRKLAMSIGLAVCWAAMALVGLAVLAFARRSGYSVPGIVVGVLLVTPIIAIILMFRSQHSRRDPARLARRIEKQFPDLDARLLAALEQEPDGEGRYTYLQQTVIDQAVTHAHLSGWERIIPIGRLRVARFGNWAMFLTMAVVMGTLVNDMRRRPGTAGWLLGGIADASYQIKVEPEGASIERGTSLLVMARFGEDMPGEVQLLSRDAQGNVQQMKMSKSLDDPVFAARIPSVSENFTYSVRYGDGQTKWYGVEVFDFPDLKQADAKLKFPEYTGLEEKLIQDTRSVTAVEGTQATFTFRLNKPVAQARLLPKVRAAANSPAAPATQPVELVVDPADPTLYTMNVDLRESRRFELLLLDDKGRANKHPAELAINVTPNRPPTLKLTWPTGDVDVSPLQELTLGAQVSDDFGVQRVGVSYSMAGKAPEEAVLAEKMPANQKRDVSQLVSFETFKAQPDELMSYFFWVEDYGPDGKVRRTASDMFFAEVRPFEQIFRQGQQPSESEQQQQQQQQQNQQGAQNAQDAEQLADLQKDIIAATWKVMRRETSAPPTTQFAPDVKLIGESQTSAREQAAALDERLTDERSKGYLQNVLKNMDAATKSLTSAGSENNVGPLAEALSAEQAAYQDLLKLRAREFEVVRGSRQQRGQQQARSSNSNRRQRQMNQLDLAEQDNRYEAQRNAAAQQEDPQQRETRQVLSRLRELAQRQEDLNREMRELQSALEQAQSRQQREEIERQLARLRDQQQQQLRDADDLRDRMDQPANQEQMADSRQQLEESRENLRKASEALEQNRVPEAGAAGARAAEELSQLRDQFRRNSSGQFAEAVNQMRQQARELDETQKQLSEKLSGLNEQGKQEQRTLRDGGEREQIVEKLGEQTEQLKQLTDSMRKTIEDAEVPEPLLSRGLYEAVRQAGQKKTDEALDLSRRLLDRGFVGEARQAEREAASGISQLRDGIERAAESVLGGQAEALQRARDELDALSRQLDREIDRNQPPTSQPGGQQIAQNNRDGRRDQQSDRSQQPGEQQGQQPGQQPGAQPGEQQAQNGQPQPGQRGRSGDPSQQGRGQNPQLADAGQQRGGRQGRGQQPGQQAGQQPGQQPGEQPGGQRGGDRGRGAQAGRAGRGGQPQDGQAQAGGLRQGGRQGGRGGQENQQGDLQELLAGGGGPQPGDAREDRGPIAGDGFRDWADRLRDVEEMVDDPGLRARAAQIRDRARNFRVDRSQTGKPPNWEIVRETLSQPLVELRNAVAEELLRRQSSQALVPIDREPVPSEYADKVRRYYESLGEGRGEGRGGVR